MHNYKEREVKEGLFRKTCPFAYGLDLAVWPFLLEILCGSQRLCLLPNQQNKLPQVLRRSTSWKLSRPPHPWCVLKRI